MNTTRAPFRSGRVLSRTFAIWGRGFLPFVLLNGILHSPLILHAVLAEPGPYATHSEWRTFVAIQNVGQFLIGFMATAAVIHGVLQRLRGEPILIGRCIVVCIARLLPALGVLLCFTLFAAIGLFVFGLALGMGALPVATGIVLCGAFLWLAYLVCTYGMAIPVTVVERKGVFASLRRSAELTRGVRVAVFSVFFVIFVILLGVGFLGAVAFMEDPVAQAWLGLLVAITVGALGPVANAVSYHDLRVAKEGVATEDLVRIFA